ncbi:hypothetical protein AB9R79_20010, partial [Vibrio splendidus]
PPPPPPPPPPRFFFQAEDGILHFQVSLVGSEMCLRDSVLISIESFDGCCSSSYLSTWFKRLALIT